MISLTDLALLESRLSRNWDMLLKMETEHDTGAKYQRWQAQWEGLLADYEIGLAFYGLTCAPGGEWDKKEF